MILHLKPCARKDWKVPTGLWASPAQTVASLTLPHYLLFPQSPAPGTLPQHPSASQAPKPLLALRRLSQPHFSPVWAHGLVIQAASSCGVSTASGSDAASLGRGGGRAGPTAVWGTPHCQDTSVWERARGLPIPKAGGCGQTGAPLLRRRAQVRHRAVVGPEGHLREESLPTSPSSRPINPVVPAVTRGTVPQVPQGGWARLLCWT